MAKCREYLDTAMDVMTSPREFFVDVRREKLKHSARYLLKMNLVVPVLLLIITLIVTYSPLYSIESAIRLYLVYLLLIVVGGLWSHVWLFIFGARKGFEQTTKAAFYSASPALLFGWIPLLAPIFWLWSTALFVVGSAKLHRIPVATALLGLAIGWVLTFWVILAVAGPTVSQTLLPMLPA